MKITITFAKILALFVALPQGAALGVSFDWAVVSNPYNTGELSGSNAGGIGPDRICGAVDYTYRISQHEVTNAQYTDFLNAVADADPNGLYHSYMGSWHTRGGIVRSGWDGSYDYAVKSTATGQGPGGTDYTYADKPVVNVSYFDAMRFTNWLENDQPTGPQGPDTTETGVYTISDGLSETREPDATYFIPSEDEWYKAAYHDATAGTAGVYFDYPTGTDVMPDNNLPSADTGNSANFWQSGYTNGLTTGDLSYPMTDVGDYTLSESPYGTFDQGGNVREWNEAVISSSYRSFRGGGWGFYGYNLSASYRFRSDPSNENDYVGFRVASIPEPGSLAIAGLMAVLTLGLRSRMAC